MESHTSESLPSPRKSFVPFQYLEGHLRKSSPRGFAVANICSLKKKPVVGPHREWVGNRIKHGPKSVSSVFTNSSNQHSQSDFVLVLSSRASQGTRLLSSLRKHGPPLSSLSIQGCNKLRYPQSGRKQSCFLGALVLCVGSRRSRRLGVN